LDGNWSGFLGSGNWDWDWDWAGFWALDSGRGLCLRFAAAFAAAAGILRQFQIQIAVFLWLQMPFCHFLHSVFHGASILILILILPFLLLLPSVFGVVSSDSLNKGLNEHSGSMRTDFVLTFSATLIPNTQMQSPVCWWLCSPQNSPIAPLFAEAPQRPGPRARDLCGG